MKAIQLTKFGPGNAVLGELERPEPGPGQVLVKMHAASINYRDFMIAQGFYRPDLPLPIIPLSDGAGEVVALGDGVDRVKVGDRVTPTFFPKWISGDGTGAEKGTSTGCEVPGTLAEYGIFDQDALCTFPDFLSYEEAACFPCAGLTAWAALAVSNIKAGDTVLAMGTGGVALFAIQFAKALGANAIVISSSDDKIVQAKDLGASHGVNYKTTPEWADAVLELTDGKGVDSVMELGGAGTLPQSLKAIRIGGHVPMMGNLAGIRIDMDIFPILVKNAHIHGITVGNRDTYEKMWDCVGKSEIRPVIYKTYDFEDGGQAIQDIAAGSHVGKLTVKF